MLDTIMRTQTAGVERPPTYRSPSLSHDVRYASLGSFLKATNFMGPTNPPSFSSSPRTSIDDGSLDFSSLSTIQISFASSSMGKGPSNSLPKKIAAAEVAGFQGIELCMPDLVAFAAEYLDKKVGERDWDDLCTAAAAVKEMCDSLHLCVVMLQSLDRFEGWPEDSIYRKDAFDRARGWIRVMKAVGTDMLQVTSSDTPIEKIGSDRSRFIRDLQELADMLAENQFRLAYENCCWSTHAPKWSDAWDIVDRIERSNVGLCLDTFHIAGSECVDATTESGLVETVSIEELADAFEDCLVELSHTIPKEKIFVLQISDVITIKTPLIRMKGEHILEPRKRLNQLRTLPFGDGYLPVIETTKAILRTGYRGWFSYEVVHEASEEKRGGGVNRIMDTVTQAREAVECHRILLTECAEDE